MLALGIIFIIFGIVSAAVGANINNNMDLQFKSFYENGQLNPGDLFLYLGIGLIVLGIIFVIAGIVKSAQKTNTPPWAMYGAPAGTQPFKCCRCGYTGFFCKVCPICKCKQTMLPYTNNAKSVHSPANSINTKSVTKCRNCGAVVSLNNKFCANCGKEIEIAATGKATCLKCGAAVQAGSVFCANCGSKL